MKEVRTQTKKEKIGHLKRKVIELGGSSPTAYHVAHASLMSCAEDKMMGSGVLLSLSFLGGKAPFEPIVIRDGLSKETIEAIKRDIKRSYDLATLFKI